LTASRARRDFIIHRISGARREGGGWAKRYRRWRFNGDLVAQIRLDVEKTWSLAH
jgi:hypothetical protein